MFELAMKINNSLLGEKFALDDDGFHPRIQIQLDQSIKNATEISRFVGAGRKTSDNETKTDTPMITSLLQSMIMIMNTQADLVMILSFLERDDVLCLQLWATTLMEWLI